MGPNQLYKGNPTTIVLKLLEEKGRMYAYQITQKVKAISAGELVITEETILCWSENSNPGDLFQVTIRRSSVISPC